MNTVANELDTNWTRIGHELDTKELPDHHMYLCFVVLLTIGSALVVIQKLTVLFTFNCNFGK